MWQPQTMPGFSSFALAASIATSAQGDTFDRSQGDGLARKATLSGRKVTVFACKVTLPALFGAEPCQKCQPVAL